MLGKRSDQKGLWEADRLYLDYVGQDTFYGLLASLRGQLFSDDDFAEIYGPDNGRDSVPPSLLATALLLQTYDKVREVFESSLRLARQSGYLNTRSQAGFEPWMTCESSKSLNRRHSSYLYPLSRFFRKIG